MGHIKHDAVIFTTWNRTAARRVHAEARAIFGTKLVTPLCLSPVNAFNTFVVLPHGSKDNWEHQTHWNSCLKMLFQFINDNFTDEDSDHSFDWAHVTFGGDDWDVSVQTKQLKLIGEA